MRRIAIAIALGSLVLFLPSAPSAADVCPSVGTIGNLLACGLDGVWSGGITQLPNSTGWEAVYQRGGLQAFRTQTATSVWATHVPGLLSPPDRTECVITAAPGTCAATTQQFAFDPGVQVVNGQYLLAEWHYGFSGNPPGDIYGSTRPLDPSGLWSDSAHIAGDSANSQGDLGESSFDAAGSSLYVSTVTGTPGTGNPYFTQQFQSLTNWGSLVPVIQCSQTPPPPCVTPGPNGNEQRANVAATGNGTVIAVWNGSTADGGNRSIWLARWDPVQNKWVPSTTAIAGGGGAGDLFNPFALLVSSNPASPDLRVYFEGWTGETNTGLGYVKSTDYGITWTGPYAAAYTPPGINGGFARPVMTVSSGHVYCLCSWKDRGNNYYYLSIFDTGQGAG
jgi:hypothetical protein